MVVTTHFIDDNCIVHKHIINFRNIVSHRDKDTSRDLLESIDGLGIKNIMTMTFDNVYTNDKAVEFLMKPNTITTMV